MVQFLDGCQYDLSTLPLIVFLVCLVECGAARCKFVNEALQSCIATLGFKEERHACNLCRCTVLYFTRIVANPTSLDHIVSDKVAQLQLPNLHYPRIQDGGHGQVTGGCNVLVLAI